MSDTFSRRDMIYAAALMSCGGICAGVRPSMAQLDEDERAKLRRQVANELQIRQVDERMLLFKELVAKYGKQLLVDVREHTVRKTRERLESPEVTLRDLGGVKAYLWDHMGDGFELECLEDTPTRLSYRVGRCFLAEAVAKHDAGEIGAAFYCAYDEGFCQGLNPKIVFTRTKTLMTGDSCCNHTYELLPG